MTLLGRQVTGHGLYASHSLEIKPRATALPHGPKRTSLRPYYAGVGG